MGRFDRGDTDFQRRIHTAPLWLLEPWHAPVLLFDLITATVDHPGWWMAPRPVVWLAGRDLWTVGRPNGVPEAVKWYAATGFVFTGYAAWAYPSRPEPVPTSVAVDADVWVGEWAPNARNHRRPVPVATAPPSRNWWASSDPVLAPQPLTGPYVGPGFDLALSLAGRLVAHYLGTP